MSKYKNLNYLVSKAGLYEKIDLSKNLNLLEDLFLVNLAKLQLDTYCPKCGKDSIFNLAKVSSAISQQEILFPDDDSVWNSLKGYAGYHIALRCSRDSKHITVVHYVFEQPYVIKIGQYPSVADLELNGTNKYSKLLDKDYSDYKKSIGLFSHGVGAGSYVYLRRIFENVILETYNEAKEQSSWLDDNFMTKTMDNKIKALEVYLPSQIAGNVTLYKILSKGIHSLSEQECLNYYPVLRTAIEIILDDKLKRKEEAEKLKDLEKAINNISTQLS